MNIQSFKKYAQTVWLQLRLFAGECLVPALILNMIVEVLSRKSVVKPVIYLFTSPLVFFYNTLLIAATLSVTFLFKRRFFARFILYMLWLLIGITDFILLRFRVTPFTGVDLLLLDSAFSIMNRYLNILEMILLGIAFVGVVAFGVFLYLRSKKETEGTSKLGACTLAGGLLLITFLVTRLFTLCGILDRNFGNLSTAYHDNGLPYCFTMSIFNTGISKPTSYSEEEIDRIISSLQPSATPVPTTSAALTPATTPGSDTPTPTVSPTDTDSDFKETTHPNFIFLQLESFFDPKLLKDATYSDVPAPFFRYLKNTCPSGYLSVPSIGAGTANTEFEIITGMNLDFFGPGEYPYKTYLRNSTCESLAYNLSALGLTAHAIHNNDGDFYDRNNVFSKLGFSTFTSIEYMGHYEVNPIGWAKDKILVNEIMSALQSTDGQDFIYAISVQGHGSYPNESSEKGWPLAATKLPEEFAEVEDSYNYYLNQISEMDSFLGSLYMALRDYDEEVVLVLYGDHLPAFPFTDEMLESESVYRTEYVIWNNHRTQDFADCDLEAYELGAHVLNEYGIHEGLFTKFHQTQRESETYLADMELLEYDVLYGSCDSYGGENPFVATELQMGIEPIVISEIQFRNAPPLSTRMFVNGTNFTPYSIVYINEEPCTTTYITSELLIVTELDATPGETLEVSVAQVTANAHVLSMTDPIRLVVPEASYYED